MSESLRVLVVEDHRMFADAIRLLLDATTDIDWVGTATRGDEAVRFCAERCPDVILMDIDLPPFDGIEATRRVRDLCPEVRVIALTALEPDVVLAKVIEAGACGLVPKTRAAEELMDAIRRAAAGEFVVPAGDLAGALTQLRTARDARRDAQRLLGQLTSRETEILQTLAEGKSVAQVARALFISPHTVQSHLRSILVKLGVHSRQDAVILALRHGLIRPR